nr:type VI secretion system baseplate subunit TssF [Escherichia coli]
MSVQQEHATSETATLTTTESGGVYQSLFDKINLTPVSSIQEIDLWQNSETLADASPDERVTAAIHVLLSCLAKSGENVVKLDKSLLDFHIDDLDQKISKQLDAVMHHPEFQKVESLWRGTWFVVQRTDFRKNVRIELLDISKEHLRQDFDDSPEIIQSGLYRHTYIQEYDTPGGEPVASLISSYEFDNSPQDIALLRNISRVSAASHMPFIGSVGPKFFLKNSMEEVAAIKDIGNYFDRAEYIKWKSFRDNQQLLAAAFPGYAQAANRLVRDVAVDHLQQQLNAFVALPPNSPQRTATGEQRYKQLKALLMTSRPEKADAAFFSTTLMADSLRYENIPEGVRQSVFPSLLTLRLPGQDRRTRDAHFSPLGFEDNDRLWPKGESAFSGYQLLLEYFTFREKFMFVALNGLELVAWPEGITGFEIDVVLNENWPHDLPFDSDNIRLHCVPVINLFPLEADPLHLSPLENEFLLRPMRIQDGHTEIYSVDNIISSRHTGSQAYVPFSSFRHRGGMLRHDAPERYYHTRVKRGPSGLHDTWLILGGDAFDADRMLEDETLSLSLTGTNGHLPRKALQSTLLDRPVHASQNVLRVRNLCAPTQPCYPPARDRFHWRVLSHLGSNFLSMMDNAEILRGTLALYDWTESEMNRRRLEAIVDVQHSLIQRFERGFLLRGVDIQVTLDSNGFAGEGDITLFGELLHRFFALYADIHLFTQLTLILQPTGKCLQWTEHHSQRVPG